MNDVVPICAVAESLTVGLWREADLYFSQSAHLDPAIRQCWDEAVAVQGLTQDDFQMPEPFAGWGGHDSPAPRLLVVGSNPGFTPDQDFPRWGSVQGNLGLAAYLDFFWRGFDADHRGGHSSSGAPLAWSRDRTRLWPIPHYWKLEAILGGGALAGPAWEVDALPWKAPRGRRALLKKKYRTVTDRIARWRIAKALGAIERDAHGIRRVLVLGNDAAELLGLPLAHDHQWRPLCVRGTAAAQDRVAALIAYHPASWSEWREDSFPALHEGLRL